MTPLQVSKHGTCDGIGFVRVMGNGCILCASCNVQGPMQLPLCLKISLSMYIKWQDAFMYMLKDVFRHESNSPLLALKSLGCACWRACKKLHSWNVHRGGGDTYSQFWTLRIAVADVRVCQGPKSFISNFPAPTC